MSKYYYLVAGLPELTLEDSKLSYTVADFKTELYPALSEDDKKLIDLFYLKFDNANVLKLLKDKDAAIDPRGNYSSEELVEYISQLKDGDEVSDSVFPSYLSTFISEYFCLPRTVSCMKTAWQRSITPMLWNPGISLCLPGLASTSLSIIYWWRSQHVSSSWTLLR